MKQALSSEVIWVKDFALISVVSQSQRFYFPKKSTQMGGVFFLTTNKKIMNHLVLCVVTDMSICFSQMYHPP